MMKTVTSFCGMGLWKWIFVALLSVSFLLSSAYYSIGTSYILYINNTEKMISPVERNKLEYEGPFRSDEYSTMMVTTTENSAHSTTSLPVFGKGKVHWKEFQKKGGDLSNKANFDRADKYEDYFNDKQTRNDNSFLKTPSSISKEETKKIPPTKTNNNDHIETLFSPPDNKFVETNERGVVAVNKDQENKSFNENNATPRKVLAFTRYQAGRDDDDQHTNMLERATGSSIKENKYNKSKGRQISPEKFKGLSGVKRTFPLRRRVYDDLPIRPDNAYAIPDLESLRINKTLNSTFVLLVTYARSGSTWLGEITNQAKQTVYVFEPLQIFVKQGYYKENLVCYNNNTCRKPRIFTETHNFAITTLHRLFTCQFSKLHPKAVSIFIKNLRSHHATTFKSCMKIFWSTKKCLQRLESICSTSTHRVLKTIRISMELVAKMMDMWPNLKIVHLVRDPRGITSSRLSSKTFNMARELVSHSHDMCDRMSEDVELDSVLNKKYFNRLKLVFYESLAEMPLEGAKFIYSFLNLTLTDDVINWVNTSTHAEKGSGYFGTMRSNASESAYKWRSRLTLLQIKVIDNICEDIYKILGFMPLHTSQDLRDSSIPTRQSVKNINWFS